MNAKKHKINFFFHDMRFQFISCKHFFFFKSLRMAEIFKIIFRFCLLKDPVWKYCSVILLASQSSVMEEGAEAIGSGFAVQS